MIVWNRMGVFALLGSVSMLSSAADDVKPPEVGTHIVRTMTDLATSTPEKRNSARILFYGQSIIAQSWSHAIANRLKKEYPNADISYVNRSIGGFSAERLVKTSLHDMYPYYPDLVFFHDYGGVDGELEAMLASIRKLTTAEIVILTHHVSHPGNAWVKNENDKQSQLIRDLAAKYDCECVDVREEWTKHLADKQIDPKSLLADDVHLNPNGCKLMEDLVWRHLHYDKNFANPHAAWVKTVPVQSAADGSIKISFTGNRVDLVAAATDKPGTAKILVDGKPPSANPLAYAVTRPSNALDVWWPAVFNIGNNSPLLVEDWTLKITEINEDATAFKFDVVGSKTGPDGSGGSDAKFVSTSGRVVIDPKDFGIPSAQKYSKKKCPVGFEVKWSVVPMFRDIYTAPKTVDPSNPPRVTLTQLIENGPHTLELVPNGDGATPVKEFVVYQPPLK